MKEFKTLLIDAGNSRIKVSSIDAPSVLVFNAESELQLSEWLSRVSVQTVWAASVRKANALTNVREQVSESGGLFHRVHTEKHKFGLTNSYSVVENMGVDRWLSMLSVAKVCEKPFAVFMFGTAITCDIVMNNRHVGGWIAPGRELMHNVLTTNTANVFHDNTEVSRVGFGESTPDCVSFGCFAAAHGLVNVAREWLRHNTKDYQIYITGGDSNVLTSLKSDDTISLENLVLKGLARYAGQN